MSPRPFIKICRTPFFGTKPRKMKFLTYLQRIQRMDRLIRMQATGSPCELAESFNISESSLYELIRLMKDLGGPIYYCRNKQSYCYHENVLLEFTYRNVS